MKCAKCKGFMIADDFIDLQESLLPMWMRGWRCLACGNIVDPLILRNRRAQQTSARQVLKPKHGVPVFAASVKARAA